MIATVIPHVDDLHADQLVNRTVVMIDAFRASSCMVTALANGALFIIPAETVSKARELATDGILTGGERFGKSLEGFDLGNSPADYSADRVNNKGIVMTTTNGTRALLKADRASEIRVGCFLNASSCAKAIRDLHRDVVFLCAGTRGSFSLEDGMAAGCILHHLLEVIPSAELSDLAHTLRLGYLSCRERLTDILPMSQAGRRLIARGHRRDLLDCLQRDRYDIVPRWQQGRIIR
ncbi:2-phosphosulfolactate phosphatase [Kroppenstedtia eburnea]|uniref:2-phosphosulfolactate phosphatase n=1 Tax=Kroppenstedtia eburnea TaxID=714067 RepID=UPI00020C6A76|nr:2-phosphosulfolactate phosphatase [Desmospora sp. 8437]